MQNKTLSTAPPSWCDWTRQSNTRLPRKQCPWRTCPLPYKMQAMQTDENRLGSLLESGRIWKDCSVPKLSSIQHSPNHLSSWRPCERSKASRSNVPVRRRESAWAKVSSTNCHWFLKRLKGTELRCQQHTALPLLSQGPENVQFWYMFGKKHLDAIQMGKIGGIQGLHQEKCAIKKENVWKCRKMWKHVERWKDAFCDSWTPLLCGLSLAGPGRTFWAATIVEMKGTHEPVIACSEKLESGLSLPSLKILPLPQ